MTVPLYVIIPVMKNARMTKKPMMSRITICFLIGALWILEVVKGVVNVGSMEPLYHGTKIVVNGQSRNSHHVLPVLCACV